MDPKEYGKHKRALYKFHKSKSVIPGSEILHGNLIKREIETVPMYDVYARNANSDYDPEKFKALKTTTSATKKGEEGTPSQSQTSSTWYEYFTSFF